jgi:hypothetical protein
MAQGVGESGRAQRNKGKGGACNAFSLWAQVTRTKAEKEADKAKRKYEEKYSTKVKEEEKEVEAVVIGKWELTSDAQILEEFSEWMEDPIYSRTRDMKYFKIYKMYWLVKNLVARALEKTK